MLDQFQMGPNLVRGFAPNGIGPRDINPFGTRDALGGTKYWGASFELQMPFWFLPKEVGSEGRGLCRRRRSVRLSGPDDVGADRRSHDARQLELLRPTCRPSSRQSPEPVPAWSTTTAMWSASSVGVGLIWASPFGPLRFDYAVPLTKGQYDRVQQFRFGGGTSF